MIKEIFKKQVVKNSLINFIAKGVGLVISIIFVTYISRKLTKFELGVFAVMNIFMGVIPLIVGLGLATSAIRLVPELKAKGEHQKVSDIIKLTISLPIPETILITLLGVLLSKFLSIAFLKSSEYSGCIIWILFISFFYSIFDRIILVCQSLQEFGKIAILFIFTNLISRRLAVILLLKGYGMVGIFQGFLIGTFLGVVIGFFTLREYIFSKYHGYSIKEYIKFSFPYYLQGWARFAFNQADQFLVALIFVPEILAVYFIAKKIIFLFTLILESLLEPLIPKLAENKSQNIEIFSNNFKKSYYIFSTFALFSSLFLLINSKNFMYLLGGIKFYNQFAVLNILSVSMFFYFLFSLYSIWIYLLYQPIDILKLKFLVGIFNILFGFLLGLKLGLVGFAIGQSFGFIIGIFIIYSKYKINDFKFLLEDIKKFTLVIVTFIIGYILNLYFLPLVDNFSKVIRNFMVNLLLFSFLYFAILRRKIKEVF